MYWNAIIFVILLIYVISVFSVYRLPEDLTQLLRAGGDRTALLVTANR